jgi:hypothetical protein
VFFLPLPGILEELLTGEVFLIDSHSLQLRNDLIFCSDAGVVRSGDPAGILSVHTGLADKDVVERVVKDMAHVKDTCHIGRGYYDSVRFSGVGLGMETLILKPISIPFIFYFRRIVFT